MLYVQLVFKKYIFYILPSGTIPNLANGVENVAFSEAITETRINIDTDYQQSLQILFLWTVLKYQEVSCSNLIHSEYISWCVAVWFDQLSLFINRIKIDNVGGTWKTIGGMTDKGIGKTSFSWSTLIH